MENPLQPSSAAFQPECRGNFGIESLDGGCCLCSTASMWRRPHSLRLRHRSQPRMRRARRA